MTVRMQKLQKQSTGSMQSRQTDPEWCKCIQLRSNERCCHSKAGVVLGVSGADLSEIHDTVEKLEGLGNKNLVIDVTGADVKETFKNAVQIRKAAIKDGDRTFGYPSIVNLHKIAKR